MRYVVLTELGISVLNGSSIERSFGFSDPVKEYMAVKSNEAKLADVAGYLGAAQRGVATNDTSLLRTLKKCNIDARIMDDAEMESFQNGKTGIIIESGFASNPHDMVGKLRKFALGLSSSKVAEASESPDLHIIQAINSLDEIDRIANSWSSRVREWYGLHFPELGNVIDSMSGYARVVMSGRRESMTRQGFEDAGFPESKAEMLMLVASKSRGGDISDQNLAIVQSMAGQLLAMYEIRKSLEEHIGTEMDAAAPNLAAVLGPAVGARMLGRVGGIRKMASLPASTIQVLGAEKALFRALKTGAHPPKHGLLFQHPLVHAAPRWQRGKIARAIATKAAIAARVDVYGQGLNETLLEKLNIRVDEIAKKHQEPSRRGPERRPGDARRHRSGRGRRGNDGRREGKATGKGKRRLAKR